MQDKQYPFKFNKSAPFFSGHFADNPVVPGAIILEQVMLKWAAFSENKMLSFDYTKFINPLLAEVSCTIEFIKPKLKRTITGKKDPNKFDFRVITDDNLVICKGRLIYD